MQFRAVSFQATSPASISPDDELFTEDSPSRGATPSRPASACGSASASNLDHPPSFSSQPQDANATSNGVASSAQQDTSLATRGPDSTAVAPHYYRAGYKISSDVSSDGRIRNPIPSKFLDSATEKDGNFAVMHMDVGKPVMDARSMAAKRTSELTQAAAMQANKNGYQPIKRSRLVWNTPFHDQQQHPSSHEPAPPYPLPRSLCPLAVKAEQARILTLLRSIHPVIVVDQLCKAMAYFGGIPGAPPPPNNAYPQSDKRNGSGALFIGWLSEIFPPADFTKPPFAPTAPGLLAPSHQPNPVTNTPDGGDEATNAGAHEQGQPQPQPPVERSQITQRDPLTPRRPRGRPKGSKSSKVRKDKGIKKGSRVSDATFANTHTSASNFSESMESQGGSSQNPTSAQPSGDSNRGHQPMSSQFTSTPTQVLGDTSITETPGSGTPSGKKRGRPKGSKNKPKPILNPGTETAHDSPITEPRSGNMDRVVAVGWMPADVSPTQRPPNSSQVEHAGHVTRPANGLSQHAENWADPPIQDHSQPSEPSSQRADEQANKRKAIVQAGENDYSLIQTNGQGQLRGSQQPQQLSEPQAIQNKRPRLSKDTSESAIVSPTESVNGRAPTTLTTPASQDAAYSSSALHNYDLSPTVGAMSVQSAQPQYQQPQVSQNQQQMQEQGPANVDFNRMTKGSAHPFGSQQPQQAIRERSTQNRQAFYNQQQHQNQQRAQQYQRLQSQSQFAQLKAASNIIESSQTNNPSPGSSPTEARRPNPPVPTAHMSYPAAYSNDSAFLAMEYAMSANRAVEQSQDAFASQPTQTQLEAALTDADMRGGLYQTFGGRR
ncbi:unnamed protein product [Clonostachys rosea]|uniref:Uncharacterized protein n=1 Tax=Bionectria ochroleuca TaxID=29856 RepID=A0ABY6TV87_BIOOC|nr:unnamed protein product [Clonostachys rosea]